MSSPKKPPGNDCSLAAVTAAVLRQGRIGNYFSISLSLIALARISLLTNSEGHGSSHSFNQLSPAAFLIGLLELYLATRVSLDADLFEMMKDKTLDPAELDNALTRLALRQPAGDTRDIHARAQGSLRLLKYQALCILLQAILMCLNTFQ